MENNNKKPSVHLKYAIYPIDLSNLKFEPKNSAANANESCEKLIKFSKDLNSKILETSANTAFKNDLNTYIQALVDQTHNPTDNERIVTYKELHGLITNRIHELKD
jgi:hypothetical protein